MDKSLRSTTATTIRSSVPFSCGDHRGKPLEGELVFDPTDAYAVSMHLAAKSGTVVWTFARELLSEGLYEPVGDGDVQIWPCLSETGGAVVIIELRSPEGAALIHAPARAVRDFVARTQEVVPMGQEGDLMPLDTLISQLLSR